LVRKKQTEKMSKLPSKLNGKFFHDSKLNRKLRGAMVIAFKNAILVGVKLLVSNMLQSTKKSD
jgi:hypothetical protein